MSISSIFETLQYLNEEGILSPNCRYSIPFEILLKGYQTMFLTRHVDERMITLQRQGEISFALSSLGEECCAVATAAALDFHDWIYPQYREAGVMFWRGFSIQDYVHHMFCNGKDLTLGRQMPNHFGSRALNVVTVSSPIGTKIPHAAGCAFAMKLKKQKQIALCFFGEGAASEGDFHAGLNFAAVKKAPVIFFCRNNGFAISTPTSKQYASEGIAPRGIAYNMLTYRVDGNDFFAVHEVVSKSRNDCLEGKGPVLIEAMTYRLGAHSTSDDPTRYRTEEELIQWKKKDPLLRLKKYLESQNLWNLQEEEQLQKKISETITHSIEVAKNTPPPPLKSMFEHVYFEMPETLKEQYESLKIFFSEQESKNG